MHIWRSQFDRITRSIYGFCGEILFWNSHASPLVWPVPLGFSPVLSILKQRGIRLIAYLDDILLMAPSVDQVLQHVTSTLNLLEGLGVTVNYQKFILVPSQQMQFLGSLVNSVNLTLSLPKVYNWVPANMLLKSIIHYLHIFYSHQQYYKSRNN